MCMSGLCCGFIVNKIDQTVTEQQSHDYWAQSQSEEEEEEEEVQYKHEPELWVTLYYETKTNNVKCTVPHHPHQSLLWIFFFYTKICVSGRVSRKIKNFPCQEYFKSWNFLNWKIRFFLLKMWSSFYPNTKKMVHEGGGVIDIKDPQQEFF